MEEPSEDVISSLPKKKESFRQIEEENANNNNVLENCDKFCNNVIDECNNADIKMESNNPNQALSLNSKTKYTKPILKNVGLKRVSFGSSKGSMVETLVFESPTPLSEEPPQSFEFSQLLNANQFDDSGIEVQEESERSCVRVSIYQSNQPQQIFPLEPYSKYEDTFDNYILDDIMTAAAIPGYDRQQSTDSGWDNPFRPGGDLSREADEIVNMIKGGKPITPTEDYILATKESTENNGNAHNENVTKVNVTKNQSSVAQNGSSSNNQKTQITDKSSENNGVSSSAQVSKQVVPGPTSASHVIIDEKKNKKKGCCVIQ